MNGFLRGQPINHGTRSSFFHNQSKPDRPRFRGTPIDGDLVPYEGTYAFLYIMPQCFNTSLSRSSDPSGIRTHDFLVENETS